MARNEEKAQTMMNRWTQMKMDFQSAFTDRRPYIASECNTLSEAEKWRRQIVREIARKVAEIQNAGLGEHVIRDLNDGINKLMRERHHWDKRIMQLGGPNYMRNQPFSGDGLRLPGGAYQYFGAAKNLPGVRELFEKAKERRSARRPRKDLYKHIEPDYYGYRDDDDGVLMKAEAEAEKERIQKAVEEWEAKKLEAEKEKRQLLSASS